MPCKAMAVGQATGAGVGAGVVGSLAQLMKLEDAGVKRSMLHAMTVLFKRQPGLFSSAFTASEGEGFTPEKVKRCCSVLLCLSLSHLVRGSLRYTLLCFCWAFWTLLKGLLSLSVTMPLLLGLGLRLGRA